MSKKRRNPTNRRHQPPRSRPTSKPVDDRRARLARLSASIRRDRFTVVTVGGVCGKPGCACARSNGFGDEAWSFTIGRHEIDEPELVITGDLDAEEITWIMSRVTHEIDHHNLLERAAQGELLEFAPLRFRLDPVPSEWLGTDPARMQDWFDMYSVPGTRCDPPELLQVVWSDTKGAFPDDPECDPEVRHVQILLAQHPHTFPKRKLGRAS
jgi:Domain of unknown function (DUF4262)